jgi:hypothetical protein
MIYVCAGLFAEGRSDYELLLPLVTRVLDDVGARVFPGQCDVAATVGIDAPASSNEPREVRIARAITSHWDQCTLFIVHADSDGDAERARAERVEPGLRAARGSRQDALAGAACVPVRETEAWMLVDPGVFEQLGAREVTLPAEPERELDPKGTLTRLLREAGIRSAPGRLYAFFGERLALARLRMLPAFRAFERELEEAVRVSWSSPRRRMTATRSRDGAHARVRATAVNRRNTD